MVRRTFLQAATALPALRAQLIETGDPATEWRRSKPDFQTYLPKGRGLNDGDNEHFPVFDSPSGDLLALWTQSSIEGAGDNHLMLSRSKNLSDWTEPRCIAGPYQGSKEPQASWGFPIVSKKGRIYVFYLSGFGWARARRPRTNAQDERHGGALFRR